MTSSTLWLIAITLSVCLLVILAGANLPFVHALVCIAVNLAVLVIAWRENDALAAAGTGRAEVAAVNARYMAIVWAWAALAMAATYTTVLEWNEWWHFVIGFSILAGVSMLVAILLYRGRNKPSETANLLTGARVLAWVQIVAMAAVVVGLILDGKMDALGITPFGPRDNPPQDWAANNVFFFGGIVLALLSWRAVSAERAAIPLAKDAQP